MKTKELAVVLTVIAMLALAVPAQAALNFVGRINLFSSGRGAIGLPNLCVDQSARRAYISGAYTENIAVLDLDTQQISGFLEADGQPFRIVVDEATHHLCYTLPDEGSIGIRLGSEGPVVKVATGGGVSDPVAVASCDSTGRVYAANYNAFTVVAIKRPENTIEAVINLPDGLHPQSLICDHSRKRLYIGVFSEQWSHAIFVADADPSSPTFHQIIDQFEPVRFPSDLAFNEFSNRLYAANSAEGGGITVVDITSREIRRIEIEGDTTAVSVDEIANTIWVTRAGLEMMFPISIIRLDGLTEQITGVYENSSIGYLDVAADEVTHEAYFRASYAVCRWAGQGVPQVIAVAYQPRQMAMSPSGSLLWLGDGLVDAIHEIDTETKQVIRRLSTGGLAHEAVAFDPSGYLLMTTRDAVTTEYELLVLDPVTGIEMASAAILPYPRDIVVNATSLKAYINNEGNNRITVLDIDPASATRWQVVKLIIVDPNPNPLAPKDEPYRLAVDETRNRIYVTTIRQGFSKVKSIDGAIDEVTHTVSLPDWGNYGIAVAPHLARVYTGVWRDFYAGIGGVDILDGDPTSPAYLEAIREIMLPDAAYELCANPLTGRLYAKCNIHWGVGVIDGVSGDVVSWLDTEETGWTRMVLDPARNLLYVGATLTSSLITMEDSPPRSVGQSKKLADGVNVEYASIPVTAGTDQMEGDFYIEDPTRASGVRVRRLEPAGVAIAEGDWVSLYGTLDTLMSGERIVNDAVVRPAAPSSSNPPPMVLTNVALGGGDFFYQPGSSQAGQRGVLGGFGVNNIGLLVTICGQVTEIEPVQPPNDPTWFKIDDGSGVNPKCVVPSGVTIDDGWKYVSVTGISSCEKIGDNLFRLLRVRKQGDIAPLMP